MFDGLGLSLCACFSLSTGEMFGSLLADRVNLSLTELDLGPKEELEILKVELGLSLCDGLLDIFRVLLRKVVSRD